MSIDSVQKVLFGGASFAGLCAGTAASFTWSNLANGDAGTELMLAEFADKSVQVFGTFGVGGTVQIEGSNDGVNYAVLTDPQGNNLLLTSAKIETVSEVTAYIRPRIIAGDGTTSLTVVALGRKTKQ